MDAREALTESVRRLVAASMDLEGRLPDKIVVHTTRLGEHPVQIQVRNLQYPSAYLVKWDD